VIVADLDHVALAAERQDHLWPRYAGDLGGRWHGAGDSPGFDSAQLLYANGMKVETLEPHRVAENDFLRRFLDRNGPGPHHLTFKVPDIEAALAEVERAGFTPVGVNLADPGWMEAFLHPREVPGVVVQLAQSSGEGGWWSDPPASLPPPRPSGPATLVHAAHSVASLDIGLRLFADVLGGAEAGRGEAGDARWVDLDWPGGGRVRLLAPNGEGPVGDWLGGRPGRFHHLAFRGPDPAGIPGAKPTAGDQWVIEPDDNLGTRLVLLAASGGGEDPAGSNR